MAEGLGSRGQGEGTWQGRVYRWFLFPFCRGSGESGEGRVEPFSTIL